VKLRCHARVRGAGAVFPESLVTIYWPTAAPPSTTVADAAGWFDLSLEIGEWSETSEASTITFVEVTQTVGQEEGERVRIPVSVSEGG